MNTEKKECEKCDGKGYPYQDDNIDCDECYGTGKEQLTNTEKREKELIKEEMLNEIRIRIGCPEDDEGTKYERDVIEEIEKLLLVERWLFQEAKEPVRSEALKWLSKFGYKEEE